MELWRRRHVLDADVTLRAYLLRAVRNRALNHLRHLRVRRETTGEVEALYDEPVTADQPVVAKELAEAVEGWFATHPGEEERIQETSALVSQIDPAILRSLTTNTSNYNSFKARVRSLPAPTTASNR